MDPTQSVVRPSTPIHNCQQCVLNTFNVYFTTVRFLHVYTLCITFWVWTHIYRLSFEGCLGFLYVLVIPTLSTSISLIISLLSDVRSLKRDTMGPASWCPDGHRKIKKLPLSRSRLLTVYGVFDEWTLSSDKVGVCHDVEKTTV